MYVRLSLSVFASKDLDSQRRATATSPPSSPALQPPSLFSLLVSLYISRPGLKIDENLLWDYVL